VKVALDEHSTAAKGAKATAPAVGRVGRDGSTVALAHELAELACDLSDRQPSDQADEVAERAVDLLFRLERAA
jgi:hypothetical protein